MNGEYSSSNGFSFDSIDYGSDHDSHEDNFDGDSTSTTASLGGRKNVLINTILASNQKKGIDIPSMSGSSTIFDLHVTVVQTMSQNYNKPIPYSVPERFSNWFNQSEKTILLPMSALCKSKLTIGQGSYCPKTHLCAVVGSKHNERKHWQYSVIVQIWSNEIWILSWCISRFMLSPL